MKNYVFYPNDFKYILEYAKEYPVVFGLISAISIIVLLIICFNTWGDSK